MRLVLLVSCTLIVAVPALAASELEKQTAIDDGLAWLATVQQSDGRWEYTNNGFVDNEDTAATGSALLAFVEEGYTPGTNVVIGGNNYGDVVGKALNFLLGRAQVVGIGPQAMGNPDGDGNQVGLKFVPGGANGRDTYVTGLTLPGIAALGPAFANQVVTVGPLVGRTDGTGPGGAWTLKDVVQNTVDYYAWGQNDPGTSGRGGWRYSANSGMSDNSTAQWPVLGMLFATQMGVFAPSFVAPELRYWLVNSQGWDGGAGYSGGYGSGSGGNHARTGAWLIQAAFAGIGGSPHHSMVLTAADIQAAIDWLDASAGRWQQTPSGWDGHFLHPYALWAVYKGLQSNIGLGDTTQIANLHNQSLLRGGAGAPIDPGDTWNWWEDYCEMLVTAQTGWPNNSGNVVPRKWNGYWNWTDAMTTGWYINILAATEVPPPYIPEPGTIALFGIGLLGAGIAIRRRRRK